MRESTEEVVRDFLEWFLGTDDRATQEARDQMITDFVVWRANRAITNGVRRYVPVDGHDWHQDGEEGTRVETS